MMSEERFAEGQERFRKTSRSVAIGKAAITQWFGTDETDRLTITDTLYTPINPVYGGTMPIAHLWAKYVQSGSTDDRDAVHTSGITFELLQVDESPIAATVRSNLWTPDDSDHGRANVLHSLAADTDNLGPHIVTLTELCIELAQESAD
jgi:hypothetical protein